MLSWDRDRPAPEGLPSEPDRGGSTGPVCLWHQGFVADREELIRRFGLDPRLTDPALLAALYELRALEAPSLLAGAVSWVVWDAPRRRLVAFRDRFGVYGLFYRLHGREVRLAPAVSDLVERREAAALDFRSLALQVHGLPPAPGETCFEGVSAVPEASGLVVGPGSVSTLRYWQVDPGATLRLPSDDAYGDAVRETLTSVARGYLSRGRAGVTLSSGLDSTSVAACVAGLPGAAEMTAFTWISPGLPEADEAAPARAARDFLGLRGVEIDAADHPPLRRSPAHHSGPDSPLCGFYGELWDATFEEARERGIEVLLSGFSGDHLFGGDVFSYPDLFLGGRWLRLAGSLRAHLALTRLPPAAFLRTMFLRPFASAWGWPAPAAAPQSHPWLGPRLEAAWREAAPRGHRRHRLPGRAQRLQTLDDPLLRAFAHGLTRRAARFGVDFRHPLLDHRLVELAASLPTDQSFRGGARKIVLRNAMKGRLPGVILDRPDKIYPAAIAREALTLRHADSVAALLRGMRCEELGLVRPGPLAEAYRRFCDGETEGAPFWHALALESWLRETFP